VQCLFENIKDGIYERTPKPSLPIVDALFSEMTVLGFLSMVTFIVSSAGFIDDLSVRIYGPSAEGEEFLKELFERVSGLILKRARSMECLQFGASCLLVADTGKRRSSRVLRFLDKREHQPFLHCFRCVPFSFRPTIRCFW